MGLGVDGAGGAAGVDVGTDPEAGQRGQIVGGGGDQRLRRVFVVAAHGAVGVLFEIEQTVAEHAEAGQRLADLGLHGAQVFAHDHHAVAHAFERQDADEIVRGFAHVGAFGWRRSRRESSRGGRGA